MLVLVTGGSGFLAAHCIRALLLEGHEVRATVRSLKRGDDVRAMLPPGAQISFALADLTSDEGWAEAAMGCDRVMHVASPFPAKAPKNADDVIVPARDGTLRVLRAARDAGVGRTVLTSSIAAIGYGHADLARVFTEADWSVPDGPGMTAYSQSKLLSERAAWNFVHASGGGMELAVINPVDIFGPPLGPDLSVFVEVIARLMKGELPAIPRLTLGVVDVRDVADLHVRALVAPEAAGERFLAIAGMSSLPEIASLLRARLGPAAGRVPTRIAPDWAIRVGARFSPRLATIVPELGAVRDASAAKAHDVLGWRPRPIEQTILDTAAALANLGLLDSVRTSGQGLGRG